MIYPACTATWRWYARGRGGVVCFIIGTYHANIASMYAARSAPSYWLIGSLTCATHWAGYVGQFISYLMILIGIWLFFIGDFFDGLWIGFIGLFLLQAAQVEIAQVNLESDVAGVNVSQVMSTAPAVAPPTQSIQQTVDEYLLHTGQRVVPVVQEGLLIGIVTLRDIRQVPRDHWPAVTLGQVMTPLANVHSVRPDQPLREALRLLQQFRVGQVPALDNGRLVGIVKVEAVLKWMDIRRSLGMDWTSRENADTAAAGAGNIPRSSDTR
jgi:CBS domain-containing protein